jgi:hypothetical protein
MTGVPTIVHDVLRSSGRPLDAAARSFFEPRFGQDFSTVRVHTDAKAAESARSVNALAYTVGHDIVFDTGQYTPTTSVGKQLLAHELTHVMQQSGQQTSTIHTLRVGPADDTYESEARALAQFVAAGPGEMAPTPTIVPMKEAPPRIQRAPKTSPSWTVDELKKMLNTCDGGLGIWARAKKANGNKEPVIKAGKTSSGGQTLKGTITLEETSDRCTAAQVLIQELSNLSRQADFDKLSSDALAGDLARDAFIKGFEKIEYETGVKNVLTAFDACKDIWKCKTAEKEWARKAKDFDDYFKNFLSNTHKEGYGKWWDDNCKAAYDKKHAKK